MNDVIKNNKGVEIRHPVNIVAACSGWHGALTRQVLNYLVVYMDCTESMKKDVSCNRNNPANAHSATFCNRYPTTSLRSGQQISQVPASNPVLYNRLERILGSTILTCTTIPKVLSSWEDSHHSGESAYLPDTRELVPCDSKQSLSYMLSFFVLV